MNDANTRSLILSEDDEYELSYGIIWLTPSVCSSIFNTESDNYRRKLPVPKKLNMVFEENDELSELKAAQRNAILDFENNLISIQDLERERRSIYATEQKLRFDFSMWFGCKTASETDDIYQTSEVRQLLKQLANEGTTNYEFAGFKKIRGLMAEAFRKFDWFEDSKTKLITTLYQTGGEIGSQLVRIEIEQLHYPDSPTRGKYTKRLSYDLFDLKKKSLKRNCAMCSTFRNVCKSR